jgi:uncharacterized protein
LNEQARPSAQRDKPAQPQDPSRETGAAAGWYPDPQVPGQQRYWDGSNWTDQKAPYAAQATARAPAVADPAQARQWGMFAHLSALLGGLVGGFSFLGPLIIYLVKKDDDPFIADQSREALNFNLSALLYFVVVGFATVVLFIVLIGILLIPVLIGMAIAWLVLVIIGATRANRGELYRYPLTIRFIS